MPTLDLHTHSDQSDGTCSPAEVVRGAARRGVSLLALTDHDTVSGCAEAAAEAERLGVAFVRGVEISTRLDDHLHILGLGVDVGEKGLKAALGFALAKREERVRRTVSQLNEAGIEADFARVRARAKGSLSRAHVADYLRATNRAQTRQDAFRKYLVPGRPGYVAGMGLDVNETIAAIRGAGGAAVLAHPGIVMSVLDLPAWRTAGLGGLEAFYAAHTEEMTRRLLSLAAKYGLFVTAGSDYHGPASGRENSIGVNVSEEDFASMKKSLSGLAAWNT
ncbi:MAG: PHP domain-containing protein [Elusimicrobiales bacterium]|nr:PHP domain-containing protein [Elusimicrobiales bacterium]